MLTMFCLSNFQDFSLRFQRNFDSNKYQKLNKSIVIVEPTLNYQIPNDFEEVLNFLKDFELVSDFDSIYNMSWKQINSISIEVIPNSVSEVCHVCQKEFVSPSLINTDNNIKNFANWLWKDLKIGKIFCENCIQVSNERLRDGRKRFFKIVLQKNRYSCDLCDNTILTKYRYNLDNYDICEKCWKSKNVINPKEYTKKKIWFACNYTNFGNILDWIPVWKQKVWNDNLTNEAVIVFLNCNNDSKRYGHISIGYVNDHDEIQIDTIATSLKLFLRDLKNKSLKIDGKIVGMELRRYKNV